MKVARDGTEEEVTLPPLWGQYSKSAIEKQVKVRRGGSGPECPAKGPVGRSPPRTSYRSVCAFCMLSGDFLKVTEPGHRQRTEEAVIRAMPISFLLTIDFPVR